MKLNLSGVNVNGILFSQKKYGPETWIEPAEELGKSVYVVPVDAHGKATVAEFKAVAKKLAVSDKKLLKQPSKAFYTVFPGSKPRK